MIGNLYSATGVLLASNVLKDGVTIDTFQDKYVSKTVELDWDETQHEKIANAVAEKLGINLRIQSQK